MTLLPGIVSLGPLIVLPVSRTPRTPRRLSWSLAITFGEVGKEWGEAFRNRVREAVKEQGVEMCGEGLDMSILTPSRMARLAGEASAHSLASAIEVFTKFIQGKKQRQQL